MPLLRGRNDVDCGCQRLAVEAFPEEDAPCFVCVIHGEVNQEEEEESRKENAHHVDDALIGVAVAFVSGFQAVDIVVMSIVQPFDILFVLFLDFGDSSFVDFAENQVAVIFAIFPFYVVILLVEVFHTEAHSLNDVVDRFGVGVLSFAVEDFLDGR